MGILSPPSCSERVSSVPKFLTSCAYIGMRTSTACTRLARAYGGAARLMGRSTLTMRQLPYPRLSSLPFYLSHPRLPLTLAACAAPARAYGGGG
jgi:hypothetical protein